MPDTGCPSNDPQVQLFGLVLAAHAWLTREVGAALETSCDLSVPTFETLLSLRRSESGRLTMSEVADAILHSTGGTTRLIDRLEEAGLVERQSCPTDRRATYVAITEAGNRAFEEAVAVHIDTLGSTMGSRLNARERETLAALLTKLSEPA